MIAGMLRVKSEGRWIDRVISSILPLCDEVFVMDDHSTDNTADICKGLGATVWESPFTGLDEVRDKNWLLERVLEHKPEWIVAIDGDEILAPWGLDKLRDTMKGPYSCISLRVLYLWDREDQVRTDGVYGDFHRESVFRPNGSQFVSNCGSGFHCGNVPWGARQKRCVLRDVPLLHLGYLHKEDRIRKYEFYNANDGKSQTEDGYRHVVQGDLPQFPADAKFWHGGPLKLEPLQQPCLVA